VKVEETPPVSPVAPKSGERGVAPLNSPQTSNDRDQGETQSHPEPMQDIAALHGIDEADIEPDLRRVFVALLEEVAHLRENLDRNQKRVEFLTELSDRDPVSSLLNRRAFIRELTHGLTLLANDNGHGCLALLRVENLGEIHQARGLAIGDAVVEHVGELLGNNMMLGDIVGRVEGAVFGLIMVGRNVAGAQEETHAMVASLESHPLVHQSVEIPLSIKWALHILTPGEDAAEAMAAVDHALRRDDGLHGKPGQAF
jgi:diguanylate cyclase (GGDEF)-like protein